MKTVKNTFVTFFSLFLIFISVLSTISCEIGLGASVDTEPPKFEIAYPPIDSVIRGNFAIGGTWSDDGVIAGVTVSIKKTDSATDEVHELTGSLVTNKDSNDGTWRVIVEPKAEDGTINFTDGSYQATVVIKDSVDRATTQITTFAIDNTAPVIVLTRPSTAADTESSSFDTYGQTFNLEGQAADTNNVSLIEVKIYTDPECTEESYVYTKNLYNVPNSINMDVAKFEKGNTENDYYQIYKDSTTDGGAKNFYCRIVAYDGAQRFPIDGEQTAEDTKGNSTEEYYLYKDIATSILQPYKITEVYSILNGTFKEGTSARSINSTDVLALLNKSKRTTGRFTLNPKNNPTFTVTGQSPLAKDESGKYVFTNNTLSNGSQTVVEVSPGLDGILLDEASLKVYAVRYENGSTTGNHIYPDTEKQESGTSYKFITTISRDKGFEIGKTYLFGVEGYDQSDAKNPIEPAAEAYGFYMASSGKAPQITITSPADTNIYINKNELTFTGTVEVELGKPDIDVYVDDETSPAYTITGNEIKLESKTADEEKYSFSWTYQNFGTTSTTKKISFVAKLGGQKSQKIEKSVIYDIVNPEIKITAPSTAKKFNAAGEEDTSEKYLNGNVEFTVMLNDKGGSGLDSTTEGKQPKWEILDASNSSVIASGIITETTGQTIPVNTAEEKYNGKNIIFQVTVYDNAGNTASSSNASYTYKVDQTTDLPYLGRAENDETINYELDSKDEYSAQSGEKKNTVQKGATLRFRVYDDDGTANITILNKNISDTEWVPLANLTNVVQSLSQDTPNKLVTVSSYTFPPNDEDCGFYEYAIVATDAANTSKKTVLGPFIIRITHDKASITVERDKEFGNKDLEFTNTITVATSEGPYKLYRQVIRSNGSETYTDSIPENPAETDIGYYKEINHGVLTDLNTSTTDSLTIGSYYTDGTEPGDITVYYKVLDGIGQASTQKSVVLNYDGNAPTVFITSPIGIKTGSKAISDSQTQFTVRATDGNAESGVAKIYYKFDHSPTANIDDTDFKSEAASNGTYPIDINFLSADSTQTPTNGQLKEGSWYFHVFAEDAAGNKPTQVTNNYEFDVDLSEPSLEASIDGLSNQNELKYFKGNLTGTFSANDTKALSSTVGNGGITFTLDNTTITPTIENGTWTIPENLFTEGTQQKLTITATDWVGKTNTNPVQFTIFNDKTAPQISINPTGTVSTQSKTLSGTVNDGIGSQTVSVEWSTEEKGTYQALEDFTEKGTSWSYTADLGNTEGTKTFWFKATDALGNESKDSITFEYDFNNPQIRSIDSYSVEETNYIAVNSFTLSGKAWDTNKLSSDSAVEILQNENAVSGISIEDITNAQSESTAAVWSKDFTLNEGNYTYKVTAYDAAGRKSETITKTIVVDTHAPVVTVTESNDLWINSTAHTFRGTVRDANLKDSIEAKLLKGSTEEVVQSETIYPVNNTWSWTVTGLSDGEYKVQIIAGDKTEAADHVTTVKSAKKITVDTEKPTITVSSDGKIYNMNGQVILDNTALTNSGTYYAKEKFTLKGTVSDTNFEELKVNGISVTPEGESWSYGNNQNNDNTYEYTVTAKDEAGNTQTFNLSITKDTTPPTVEITQPAAQISDSMYKFEGTAEDGSGTQVAGVKVGFATTNLTEDVSTWYDADFGNGSWSISKEIIEGITAQNGKLCEGEWHIFAKATDRAGNTTGEKTTVIPVKSFKVDRNYPAQSVTVEDTTSQKNINGIWYTKGVFSGTITSSDTAGAVTDYYSINNGILTDLSNIDSSWTIPESAFTSSSRKLRIVTKDWVEKETKSDEYSVILDKDGPSISVNSLGSYVTSAPKLEGSVNDGNGAGVKSIGYSASGNGTYSEITGYSEGSYIWEYQVPAFGASEAEGPKHIYLKAKDRLGNESVVKDVTYIYDKSVPGISINGYSETINYVKANFTLSGKAWDSNLLSRVEIYKGDDDTASWTSAGSTASISIGNVASAKTEESGTSWTITFATGTNTSAANYLADGNYTLRIVAYDTVGRKSTEIKKQIYIDTAKPSSNAITAPEGGRTGTSALEGNSYTFKGRASDQGGSGVNKIWYAFTHSQADAQTVYTEKTVSDNNEWTITKEIESGTTEANEKLSEGNWYIHVKAEDAAGNVSEVTSVRFDIDKADPTLTSQVVKVTDSGAVAQATYKLSDLNADKKGTLVITGTASDSFGLENVKISGFTSTAITITASSMTSGAWSKEFAFGEGNESAANYLADGKYTITVIATDKARKTTSSTHTITVDTQKPVVSTTGLKIDDDAFDTVKWYDSKTLPVEAGVSDGTNGSGIKKVQISTNYNSGDQSTVTWRTASLVDGTTDRYAATIQMASEGTKTFWIKAEDAAGNISEVQSFTVKIDTSAPTLELYKYKIGNGALKSASGTVYINSTATLTVYGNYADAQSGVKALTFAGTENDTDGKPQQPNVTYSTELASDTNTSYVPYDSISDKASIKSWKAEFTNEKLKTATLSVEGANQAGSDGLSVSKNLFAISRDTTAPTFRNLNFTTDSDHFSVYAKKATRDKKDANGQVIKDADGNPVQEEYIENYYINNKQGTFIISGLAEDPTGTEGPASTVESVKLEIEDKASSKHTYSKTSSSAYFANINLSTFETSATAKITIYDYAGNSYEYTLPEIIFDAAGPTSVHRTDSTGKDIVFRLGDWDNDDINNKTADDKNATKFGLSWNTYTDTSVSPNKTYTSIDTAAGGKYAGGSFTNSATIKIRGDLQDSGSGLKQVFYKLYDRNNSLIFANGEEKHDLTETEKTALVEDVVSANQYFAPLSTADYKRVFYNVKKSDYDSATSTDKAKLNFGGNQLKKNGTAVSEKKKLLANGSYVDAEDSDTDAIEFYKFWKLEKSTYSFTIPQLNEGANYLVVVAEDNVGNYYIDSSNPIDHDNNSSTAPRTYVNYSINLDTTSPLIELNTPSDTAIKYAGASYTLKVKVTDPDVAGVANSSSGVKSVVLSANNQTVPCTKSTVAGETDIWQADVASLLKLNDSVTISATAKDIAGTTSDKVVANIFSDTTPPEVVIDSDYINDADLADGIQVNGIISIKGTAEDASGGSGLKVETNDSKTLKLYYTKDSTLGQKDGSTEDKTILAGDIGTTAGTKFVLLQSMANKASWEFTNLNTANLEGTDTATAIADNTPIYFMVSTEDKSGNVGYSVPQKVIVNQDTDRPVITLSQLAKNTETTLTVKTVYGSVSDDDGTVQKMWYWSKQANNNAAPTQAPTLTQDNSWTPITVNNGSWTVNSTDNDGETTWYFAVADAKGKIFTTLGSDTLNLPKLKYTDTAIVDGTAAGITFKYDTARPNPTKLYLYRAPKDTTTKAEDIAEDTDIAWSTESNIAFGHDFNVLYAKVLVEESTGMKALTAADEETNTEMSSPISISYTDLTFAQIYEVSGTGNDAGKYTYYLGPITMNTTEQHDFQVTVEDAVGNTGSISRTIIVDNTAPTSITRVNPSSTSEANGTFTYRGNVSDNDGGSGVTKVEWYIPKENETSETATGITWTEASLSAGWEIDFSGDHNLSTLIGYTVSGATSSVSADFDGYETGSDTGVYQLPVWFRITDAVGNIGYNTENSIRYNPNTDRPSVQITSPVHNKTATIGTSTINYVIMGGGSARISGSADDDEGIDSIYLQFDLDGDGHWDNGVANLTADLSTEPTEETTMIAGCPWTYDKIEAILDNATKYGYGIKVGTTKNWSYTLDLSSSALPSITETKTGTGTNITYSYSGNTMKVRAVSVDNDTENGQLVSAPSAIVNISVNNNIPLFSNLKLKQISGNSVTAEMEYVAGKYLTGNNWYITGDVFAYGGISSASYDGTTKVTDAKECFTAKKDSTGNDSQNEFDMKIPIIPDANSKWNVSITVFDNNGSGAKQNMQSIQINIDNTPPEFNDKYSDTQKETYGTVKHYLNSYGSKGIELTPTATFADTDGLSSIWGKVNDSGSGFSKAVFYFKRFDSNGTSNPRIYNPMGDKNANRTDLTVTAKTVGQVYIDETDTDERKGDFLPVLYVKTEAGKMTVTRPSEYAIKVALEEGATVTGVAGNANIRKGGLIKIGGVYRTISSVESDGTVNFDTPCATTYKEAEIIYAMVVDSSGESTSNDVDNDGMIENFNTVSSTTTWNAALPTRNIPDGPIELHVVLFDEAGNMSHGVTKTGISNSPLRITKVMLGTDLNGDTYYDTTKEFETYYANTNTRGEHDLSYGREVWNLDTKGSGSSYFIAKSGLAVIPEFVGGTGDVYYKFTKSSANKESAENLTADTTSETNKLKTQSSITGTVTAEGSVDGTANKIGQLVLDNSKITSNDDDATHVFSFSFWDSTESSTIGTNSSWTLLNATIYQDLVDGEKPTATITPFYWNDKENNSVKWDNGTALGHIELENDLPESTFTDGATDKEFDRDPKVSGQIYIEGEAFDETRLGSITVTFADKSVTANYTPGGAGNGWAQAANGYGTIDITDAGPSQKGHSVTWKWLVNTAEVVTNKVAATDKIIRVSANDAKESTPNTSASSSAQTTKDANTAYYKVDIVPYITELSTELTKYNKKRPSVYGRTALGKYPVYYYSKAGNGATKVESITVNGFNLSGGSVKLTGTNTTVALDASSSFTIPDAAKSGKISVIVNDIETLNNSNNDDAKGSYTDVTTATTKYTNYQHYYNRQANDTNNDILTDDVELAIWGFNAQAVLATSGLISEPVMHVNPTNGLLGFGFLSGAERASYPNGSTNSYDQWSWGWTSVNAMEFIYDWKGRMFGTQAGTDTFTPSSKASRFRLISSAWGKTWNGTDDMSDANTCYSSNNAFRLEYMGKPSPFVASPTRFIKPKLASAPGTSDNITNLYLLYYDDVQAELRFRAGSINVNGNKPSIPTNWGQQQIFNQSNVRYGDFADDAYQEASANNNNYATVYTHSSVLANSGTTYGAGSHYSIAVVPSGTTDGKDVVVAVWFDTNASTLWYSYMEDPLTNSQKNKNSTTYVNTSWHAPVRILDGTSGGYCTITVDEDKHVHIASFSTENTGSLIYTYLDTYKSSYDYEKNSCIVESYGTSGEYLNIEVAKDSKGNNVPYISYRMSSLGNKPKLAYLVDFTSSGKNGATYSPKAGCDAEDMYTGAWETIMMPVMSDMVVDNVNIGVYRYQTATGGHLKGEIREIPTRNGTVNSTSGTVGGNGTANPVMAYGIKYLGSGYIETAQLK